MTGIKQRDELQFTIWKITNEGYPSEHDLKGLFADFDTTSNRLGNTVEEKNRRLAAVIKGVESLDFGDCTACGYRIIKEIEG